MTVGHYIIQGVIELLLIFSYPLTSILRFTVPLYSLYPHPQYKTPIVIVEQWFAQNAYHIFMKRYLEKKGFRVYLFNFSLFKGGIDDGAVELKNFFEKYSLQNALIVGISAGALTSFTYLQTYNGWKKVKKLISLGGPFKGTPLAYPIVFLKSGRQLIPQSTFLTTLQKKKIRKPHRILCISPLIDEMVPTTSNRLPSVKQKKIPCIGHNNLHIWSKDVLTIIINEAKKKM